MRQKIAAVGLAMSFAAAQAIPFGASGCASTAIRVDDIPDAPIAFVYYDAATARLRAEKASKEIEERTGASSSPRSLGVARVTELADLLEQTFGASTPESERLQGRMALLDPRTGEVTLVESARRGAVPQDWSSDHQRLLFTQVVHDDLPHVFELDLSTGATRRLTYGQKAHPEGCYGPDGSVVVTVVDLRSQEPDARIMLTDAADRPVEQLSHPGYSYYPACAPDGSAVAYTSILGDGRTQHVYIRSPVRDGEPRMLSPGREPSFSADGAWIAFSATLQQESTIWRMRPDGTARKSLGRGGYDEYRPGLSPDNRLVVYVADSRYHQQLYLRRVDGTGNRILLTDGDGDRPVW